MKALNLTLIALLLNLILFPVAAGAQTFAYTRTVTDAHSAKAAVVLAAAAEHSAQVLNAAAGERLNRLHLRLLRPCPAASAPAPEVMALLKSTSAGVAPFSAPEVETTEASPAADALLQLQHTLVVPAFAPATDATDLEVLQVLQSTPVADEPAYSAQPDEEVLEILKNTPAI